MPIEPEPSRNRIAASPTFHLVVLAILALASFIPMGMIRSLITERAARRASVQHEIVARWGGGQDLRGPVLTVPYEVTLSDKEGKSTVETRVAVFLPESLTVTGELVPEVRRRGLFEQVVYTARLRFSGRFARPVFEAWAGIAPERVRWAGARLSLGVPDLRGLVAVGELDWGGRRAAFGPRPAAGDLLPAGLKAEIAGLGELAAGAAIPYAFELTVRGSAVIGFVPLGRETVVELAAPWPSPSFQGAVLPESHEISPAGFRARWRIPHLSRGYPQQWLLGSESDRQALAEASTYRSEMGESSFGVALHLPADQYQQSTRAAKYGFLFVALTFLTYFVFALLHPVSLHPIHYLLVGAALCLFYLLQLAIAEHLGFGAAYAIAAAATVALVAAYSSAVLDRRWAAGLMAALLGALYGFLYVLLRAEDFALLLGGLGLFTILGAIMFLTRRTRWS